ncbi:glycerate kinase [Pulveribacter suum]|uniref:Glycerate kinase n=1 Tax=Pulveribacter suum TaxID=2116657 RepID=A0A2P1NHV4_9BURK|nr:glycerate kinase [Pulveribacter suum]AVP56638.1 glycerate kinase [Pulveribacter suum]
MNLRNVAIPLALAAVLLAGWRAGGLQGLSVAGGGILMWGLLHFTRLMNVMQKASRNPIGHVGSAVMLNARLKAGVNLMHVVAITRSLGQQLSVEGGEPEIYRWTDAGGSQVTCEFMHGRLAHWQLQRPAAADGT